MNIITLYKYLSYNMQEKNIEENRRKENRRKENRRKQKKRKYFSEWGGIGNYNMLRGNINQDKKGQNQFFN